MQVVEIEEAVAIEDLLNYREFEPTVEISG